jgi:anaerobic magnesium-protoporphyrin IX monomethyl ester cyclase
MKICLVNPPHPYLKQPTAQAPLGLMYIAATFRMLGAEVNFLDLSDRHYEDDFNFPEAELYGLTGTVLDRKPCSVVAERIKAQQPKSRIVIGGPISLTPTLIRCPEIDCIVQGEGETIAQQLVTDFPHLAPTYQAPRVMDLDSVPFPARDLVKNLGGNVFAFNKNYKGDGSTVIITSRGCPFNCSFCASPGIWKRKVTFRSVANVLAEVDEIVNKYGIYQLRFSDDTLTLREGRLQELCMGLNKYGVIWRASIRTRPNSLEMFREMYDSGCREVSFGVESGDPDVLHVLRKGNSVEDNYQGIVNAKKAGLVVRILFMIGTPGESEQTVPRNIKFLDSVHKHYDTVALTNFLPIPGSAIADTPEDFDCTVLESNIDEFNFYMWGPQGLNEWKSFIHLHSLSDPLFQRNKELMRKYIIESGKSNQG